MHINNRREKRQESAGAWLMPALPAHGNSRAGRGPLCYLGDNGFSGQNWQPRWARDYGAEVLAPRNYCGETAEYWRSRHRSRWQVIESVLGPDWGLPLGFTRARSLDGLLGRTATKVSALNLGIRLNRHF